MKRFALLETRTGDEVVVKAPSILAYSKVRFLQRELLLRLEGLQVWPPEEFDAGLFGEYGHLYEAIATVLGFEAAQITPPSRHRFFICNDPVECNGEWQLGLSGLEELLSIGFLGSAPPSNAPVFTTGEDDLDIIADLLLMFESGVDLTLFSIQEWAAIAKQASDRRAQAQEELDHKKETKSSRTLAIPRTPAAPAPIEQLDPEFEAQWQEIAGKLQASQLILPNTPTSLPTSDASKNS